jgi:PKD repeat protein
MSCSEPPSQLEEKPTTPAEGTAPQPTAPAATPRAEPTRKPLLVWIEANPEEGKAPLTVQFTAQVKQGTPPYKLEWTFGDDSDPSSETNPVHTYSKPGSYWVELLATDAGDDDDDDDLEILVE